MGKNEEVERLAIALVMKYEQGNHPVDCHGKGVGYDIKCDDKVIEVKSSMEERFKFVRLIGGNLNGFQNNDNYYLYLVYNLSETPKLLILNKETIKTNMEEKKYYMIPITKQISQHTVTLSK